MKSYEKACLNRSERKLLAMAVYHLYQVYTNLFSLEIHDPELRRAVVDRIIQPNVSPTYIDDPHFICIWINLHTLGELKGIAIIWNGKRSNFFLNLSFFLSLSHY